MTTDPVVDEKQAARICGCKPQTLGVWRVKGCGPPFLKIGRLVRYRASDLEQYLASRRCQNTAEAAALAD
jgi:predicted DNA-binding transcriptional regulator AlpA